MKLKFIAAAALAALLGSSAASAGEDVGWYILGAVGASHADSDMKKIMNDDKEIMVEELSKGNNETHGSSSEDKFDIALKLVEGYRFNDYFALEGGYYYLGRNKGEAKAVRVDGSDEDRSDAKVTGHMLAIDAVGILPVTDRFELFGKAGFGGVMTKVHYNDYSDTKYRLAPKLGVGAEYYFVENWAVRLEYERIWNAYKKSDFKLNYDVLTVGVKYLF